MSSSLFFLKGNTGKEANQNKEPHKLKQARAQQTTRRILMMKRGTEGALITSHEDTALHAVACNEQQHQHNEQ
jgi:hypothetical protein